MSPNHLTCSIFDALLCVMSFFFPVTYGYNRLVTYGSELSKSAQSFTKRPLPDAHPRGSRRPAFRSLPATGPQLVAAKYAEPGATNPLPSGTRRNMRLFGTRILRDSVPCRPMPLSRRRYPSCLLSDTVPSGARAQNVIRWRADLNHRHIARFGWNYLDNSSRRVRNKWYYRKKKVGLPC